MLEHFERKINALPKSDRSEKKEQILLRIILLKNALKAEDLTAFDETAREVEELLKK